MFPEVAPGLLSALGVVFVALGLMAIADALFGPRRRH